MAGWSIRGLQEAQRWNSRAIANLKPSGEYGRAVRDIITQIQRAEMTHVHVMTGTLKASIRMDVSGTKGKTFIDPAAVNPKNKGKPYIYGEIENRRGGSHAFGEITIRQDAPRIVGIAARRLGRSLT